MPVMIGIEPLPRDNYTNSLPTPNIASRTGSSTRALRLSAAHIANLAPAPERQEALKRPKRLRCVPLPPLSFCAPPVRRRPRGRWRLVPPPRTHGLFRSPHPGAGLERIPVLPPALENIAIRLEPNDQTVTARYRRYIKARRLS